MRPFLDDLATGPLGLWVQQSALAYPILLVMHSIGLALLVGMLAVIDLGLLGGARPPLPDQALRSVMRLSWFGLALAATSGILLFLADGSRYYYGLTFRVKLASALLGVLLAHALRNVQSVSRKSRVLAACSLLCWLTAITAGRLMAYLD